MLFRSFENAWQTEPGTFLAYAGCDTLAVITLSFYDQINTEVILENGALTALAEGAGYQWLDCDSGFEPVPGQTAQSFTPEATGNYAVEITQNGICVDTSACYYVLVTGMTEKTGQNILVFPNPAGDVLMIEMNRSYEGTLTISGFTGKILLNKEFGDSRLTVDISQLPPGIYYLKIQTGKTSLHKKIIKK